MIISLLLQCVAQLNRPAATVCSLSQSAWFVANKQPCNVPMHQLWYDAVFMDALPFGYMHSVFDPFCLQLRLPSSQVKS